MRRQVKLEIIIESINKPTKEAIQQFHIELRKQIKSMEVEKTSS
jgi:hypothetical protein